MSLKSALEIIEILNKASYQGYIVGGFVRDYLLGKTNEDIDIATDAHPTVVQDLFSKTILTGLKHGTVTVIHNNCQFEVTTYRKESSYLNNRKPENVTFVSTLQEDIIRRDFTVNALAFDKHLKVIDYVNGVRDLENKLIKAVGDPFERFNEDALRMMRAFRFVSTHGFSIEANTLSAIKQNAILIDNISKERIIEELTKMIYGTNLIETFKLMMETEFHKYLPGMSKGIELLVKSKYHPIDVQEFLTICACTGNIDDVLNLPIPNYVKREIKLVYEMYTVEITDFNQLLLFRNGVDSCLTVNKFNVLLRNLKDKSQEITDLYQNLPVYKQCDLKFKGDDIIKFYNRAPGGWISDVLDDILLQVLTKRLKNDYEEIRQYLLKKG